MINRNNYEEYLLLYIDGELSPVERTAVETFLSSNPDLKEELELLQQTILQPEESISFSEKDVLYRKEEGISQSNYQEYFLLYVDEELKPAEKETVETFVLMNPELQDEFTLLKQTVLPKEEIIFANKELLYRKEEKRRPVIISLRWASLAAAIMIGIIAFVWILNTGNKISVPGDPTATKIQPKHDQDNVTNQQPGQTLPVQPNGEMPLAVEQEKTDNIQQIIPAKQVQQNQNGAPEQVAVVPQQRSTQTIIEPREIAANSNSGNSNPIASIGLSESNDKATTVSTPDVTGNYVRPAVYTEELNTDEEKNKNLYVGALEINTDKVRGFFRKAGRFLSNKVKSKDEDGDKIQVANLEVNKLK